MLFEAVLELVSELVDPGADHATAVESLPQLRCRRARRQKSRLLARLPTAAGISSGSLALRLRGQRLASDASRGTSAWALGVPQPVTGSQPGAAR
jgi:hypothetical protein